MTDETAHLEAEATAAMAGAPLEGEVLPPTGATAPTPEETEEAQIHEWESILLLPLSMIDRILLPQWNLTDVEKTEFRQAMAQCLNQLFPGGINGRWGCWLRLAGCSGLIVAVRAAENGGKLPAIGPKRSEEESDPNAPAPAAQS